MKFTTTVAAGCLLALTACSENNPESNNTGPVDNSANNQVIAGISLDPASRPELEALPDVSYDPNLNTNNDVVLGVADSADDGATGGDTDGTAASESGTDGSGTGGTTGGVDGDVAGAPVPPGDTTGGTSEQQFRAGTLTAADYDDQLNPHLYQRYASDFLQDKGGVLDVP